MLKRVITGLILAPLVLLCVYYSRPEVFALGLSVVLMFAAYEWTHLVSIQSVLFRVIALLIVFGLMITAAWSGIETSNESITLFHRFWLVAPGILWPYLFVMVFCYPACQKAWAYKGVVFLCMLVILPACLHLLVVAKATSSSHTGSIYIISLFLMIWGADSGAYFAGKLFGKHKLIPRVSPGKTWEGVLGGLLTIFIMRLPFSYYTHQTLIRDGHIKDLSWGGYFFQYELSWILGVFFAALMGDLLISMLKRRVSLKDTGHILPGHGGILDRIDSLLCASVVCTFWYCPTLILS